MGTQFSTQTKEQIIEQTNENTKTSLLMLLAASPVYAVVVVTEDFTYANGAVDATENGGTGWAGAWGGTTSGTSPVSQFSVSSNQAIYGGYQGATQEEIKHSRAFASSYAIDANTTLVLTFDLIVNENQLGRGIGVSLTDSGSGTQVFIGKQINESTGPGGIHAEISGADYAVLGGSRASATLTATFTSDGTDTFVKISDGSNPDVSGTIAGTQYTFDGLDLDGYHRLTTTNGVDNISIDVTTVPEPSSVALLGLGGLALILRRRK